MAHHIDPDGTIYVDTAFINASGRLPGMDIKHMGFGEFTLITPKGEVEFDRMRGKDFPGQSGRSHQFYSQKDPRLAMEIIKMMESKGKSEKMASSYTYDRTASGKTAGSNGEVTITGSNKAGKVGFRKYLTLPPSFDGAYLDQTIRKLGQAGLERVLRAATRAIPEGVPPDIYITAGYAGMDGGKVFVAAEATWKPSRDNGGEALAAALESVASREGVSVENWLN